jgi:hypothetical protein
MRFLSVPLDYAEIQEKNEIDKGLGGREYWKMIDIWLYCVLKRHSINAVSQKAWSIRERDIVFGPIPEDAEIV